MFRLPLFPLNVVLFPGALLPLHIFEQRYRRMVARCLEFDRRFGIVFHDSDRHGPFLMEEGRVGCVAEILQFQPLPDGRSVIATRGRERFRIVDGVESGEPYYEAVVEPFQDQAGVVGIYERRKRSIELFRAVVDALSEGPEEVPKVDPARETSFQLAPTIQIDPAWQQGLLELQSEAQRLDRLDIILQAVIDEQDEADPR